MRLAISAILIGSIHAQNENEYDGINFYPGLFQAVLNPQYPKILKAQSYMVILISFVFLFSKYFHP